MKEANIEDAHKLIRDRWSELQNEFFKHVPGKYLICIESYRSIEKQMALYKKGREETSPGKWVVKDKKQVVTNCDGHKNLSPHNFFPSRAIDVAVVDNQSGKVTWEEKYYLPLEKIVRELGLASGLSWLHFQDAPHIEIPNWKNL